MKRRTKKLNFELGKEKRKLVCSEIGYVKNEMKKKSPSQAEKYYAETVSALNEVLAKLG
jgi:hypothetical protein